MTSIILKYYAIVLVICLQVVLTAAEGGNKVMHEKSKNNSALRAELRGNENNRILFINNPRLVHQMHFILHSTQDGIKVYRQDNSWGDACRSFTLVEENKKNISYRIQRRPQDYARNAPLVREINKGEFLITEVNFCDGTWRIEPTFQPQYTPRLYITGHFENRQSNVLEGEKPVWTGRIDSNTVEVLIEPDCLAILNDPTL